MLQASDVGRSETLIVGIKMTILLILIVVAFARPEMKLAPVDFRAGPTDFLRSIGITFLPMPATASSPTPPLTSKIRTKRSKGEFFSLSASSSCSISGSPTWS